MSENNPPMRAPAPLRPPIPGGPPPRQLTRPIVPSSRPGGVPLLPPQQSSQQSSSWSGNPSRPMPAPPLRHIDGKGNVISGPGSFRPGLAPQITDTQMRPLSSNGNDVAGADTLSSVSQNITRPQGPFPRPNIPGSEWMMNRPPRVHNPPVRPPTGRAPGLAGGQQPLPMRPEFQQQQRQQPLRQLQPQAPSQQHHNQQQQQQQQQRFQEEMQQKQSMEQLQKRQFSQQEEDDSQKSHIRPQQQQQDQQKPQQQQPQQQQSQQQQQQKQQEQQQSHSNRVEPIQRSLSSSRPLNFNNNEDNDAYDDDDDDNDVVVGAAVTPLKSNTEKFDKKPSRQPSSVFGELTNLQNDASESSDHEIKKSTFDQIPVKSISNNNSNNEIKNIISGSKTTSKIDGMEKEKTKEGDNDSGVDESTQEKDRNGLVSPNSPVKTPTSTTSAKADSALKSVVGSRPPSATPSNKSTKSRSTSRNRLLIKTPEPEPTKKVPMNKIQVGYTPSPNLKAVRSKIGSLENATYKPGGGNVKIESKKIEIKATPRIEAKNEKYTPRGGDKRIISTKLQWNAKSKIGSLENASHKPGGGDKKIETIKTEFRDKAKPKVGSKDNVKHVPGGGDIKIQTQKLEIKAQSKVGSLDNVKHKPGGGDKKIFDDKDYLKNIEHSVALASPPSQHYWKAPKMQRATTITSSVSLPAECLVLSVSMPSLNNQQKRPKSAGPKKKTSHAIHPRPFRLY